jgi:hypothetical protein
MKYGQDYYTLRSIFFDRVPPPVVHMHLRVFDVSKDVPIGDVSVSNPSVLPKGQANGHAVEVDFPEEEKAKFDLWLRELWRDKDELVGRFYQSVVSGHETAGVDIPLELRHKSEIPDAFCFFLPALFGFVSAKLRRSV